MAAVITAAVLGLLEWRVAADNRGTDYNGIGAIVATVERNNSAPMRYRVLVPWLAWLWCRACSMVGWEPVFPDWLYQMVKVGLLAGALAVIEGLMGRVGMVLAALFTASTFEFDYWSSYAELLAVGLVIWGRAWSVALGAVVWGLSKETAVLAPVMAFGALRGCEPSWPWLLGLLGPLTLLGVEWRQGRAGLYCSRWTWPVYNLPDLRAVGWRRDAGVILSLLWSAAAVAAAIWLVTARTGAVARTAPLALVWVGAAWTLARARETRVMLPTVIWLAAAVMEAGLVGGGM